MQAVLSLRLRNTAFEDEAQYLYAGRLEIAHLFHGAPLPINFASYFSGSPVLYPVLGAAANDVGGLAAARAVSLLEMLATTALLFAISRRLFNERVAVCASLLFSVTASITFLGNFATFDASCLFLLALSSWIMVRTAASRWPLFLLAAPVAALAVATKYAGLLFVPTIAVLPVLTAWPYHRRRVFAYPVIFGVAVAALLYGALRLGGHSYIAALQQTTTSRAQGDTPVRQIGWEFIKWGGLQFGVAVLGAIAYAWRPRTDPDEQIAPAGSRLRRILLGLVLVGTALLAPAYQAHIHTDVSFHKHIGFGLFFAAPMAGVGLARIIGGPFPAAAAGHRGMGRGPVSGHDPGIHALQRLGKLDQPHQGARAPAQAGRSLPGGSARGAGLLPGGTAGRSSHRVLLDVRHLLRGSQGADPDRRRRIRGRDHQRLLPGRCLRRKRHPRRGQHPGQ